MNLVVYSDLSAGRWLALWLAGCLAVVAIQAAETPPAETPPAPAPEDPEELVNAGLVIQQVAERSPAVEAVQYYQAAIEKYLQASELRPDLYRAQALWAHCLVGLSRLVTDPPQRRNLGQAARERFSVAAALPAADWRLYLEWGSWLAGDGSSLAESPEQGREILREGIRHLETAQQKAASRADQARVAAELGRGQLTLAGGSTNRSEQRRLYELAISNFEIASRGSDVPLVRINTLWGVALLRLGDLRRDWIMIRNGIDRLQTVLAKLPDSAEVHYNLACGYALLDRTGPALQHLRDCLANDEQKLYRQSAQDDPDFESLRANEEYRQLMRESGPAGRRPLVIEPSISDR